MYSFISKSVRLCMGVLFVYVADMLSKEKQDIIFDKRNHGFRENYFEPEVRGPGVEFLRSYELSHGTSLGKF